MPPEEVFARLERKVRQAQEQRARLELERAARAAARAARHERLISAAPESSRPLHVRMAALHRRMEYRHQASAGIHRMLADRMTGWLSDTGGTLMPIFLGTVARMTGADSALAMLRGRRGVATAGASDSIAQAAHDAETIMAEGPALEAAREGLPVIAAGPALADRWPRYGAAVAELGVTSVIAAPLGVRTAPLGALCVLGREPVVRDDARRSLDGIAAALTGLLLDCASLSASDVDVAALPLFGLADSQAVINQAAGMLSVQRGSSVGDAADLLAARAFADNLSVAEIARQVIRGETDLAGP